MLTEMDGFMFFQSKSYPTVLFQNPIQIEDDPNAPKDSSNAVSLLMT